MSELPKLVERESIEKKVQIQKISSCQVYYYKLCIVENCSNKTYRRCESESCQLPLCYLCQTKSTHQCNNKSSDGESENQKELIV